MRQNELALRMMIRWRKLYHSRNRTKLNASDRWEAAGRLKEYLQKGRK